MAITLPYWALITEADLTRDQLESLTVDTTGEPVVEAIVSATHAIEQYLERQLIVRRYSMPVYSGHWITGFDASGLYFRRFAEAFPVVEVVSPSTVTIEDYRGKPGIRLRSSDGQTATVDFFAGFRRREQNVEGLNNAEDPDVPGVTPLADLTVLPPIVPRAITRKCTELTLLYLNVAASSLLGVGTYTQQVGMQTVVQKQDTKAEDKILNDLRRFKWGIH